MKKKPEKGMSLLEILVVVAIFAILGIITTRAVILTLQGSRKSETAVKVRENLDYVMQVVERQIRNANSIVECPNSDTSTIDYLDQDSVASSFSCVGIGQSDPYIASGSARLTNSEVTIISCSFVCKVGVSGGPSSVEVNISGKDRNVTGIQNTLVTESALINLRNY